MPPPPADDPEAPLPQALVERIRHIVHGCCAKYRVTGKEVTENGRTFIVVLCRDEICWRLRNSTGLSLSQIGRRLGGKDHTSVLAAVRRYEHRFAQDAAE